MFRFLFLFFFLFDVCATEVNICYYSEDDDYECKTITEDKTDNTFYEYDGDGTAIKYSEAGSVNNTTKAFPSNPYRPFSSKFKTDFSDEDIY